MRGPDKTRRDESPLLTRRAWWTRLRVVEPKQQRQLSDVRSGRMECVHLRARIKAAVTPSRCNARRPRVATLGPKSVAGPQLRGLHRRQLHALV